MTDKNRVRIGVVGCGGRGKYHLQRLTTFGDVEVVAVADASAEARNAAGETFGVEARFDSIESLLDAATPDAVVLATPAHLNASTAAVSLERGIDTLMEKPPGLHSDQTRHLRDLATKSKARCMVAWDRRFNPWITAAREAVEAKGQLLQIVGEFHKPTKTIHDARFPEELRDNMLLETPIHTIDIVRAMAGGEVTQVHSVVRRATGDYKDIHAALVSFDNGCVAQLTHNYTAGGRLERYELHGVGVSAYLEGVDGGRIQYVGGDLQLLDEAANSEPDACSTQLRYFVDCLHDGRPIGRPAADLDEAIKTMDLCEAILAGLTE